MRFTISKPGRPGCSTTTTSPREYDEGVATSAQSPGARVGAMEPPSISMREGFHRRHAHATPAATTMPATAPDARFRPRW